jgi:hypothetical protein
MKAGGRERDRVNRIVIDVDLYMVVKSRYIREQVPYLVFHLSWKKVWM